MKKVLVSIILLCYLVVSTGVIVNFHYCMNQLASTGLFASKSDQCGKCGMDTNELNGCCHDEVQLVKMCDDQNFSTAFLFDLAAQDALYQKPSDFIITSFYNVPVARHFLNHFPPLLSAQDTYLQNSVFRI